MTIDEISSLVAQRLLQGTMNHSQFSNYYNFLGLEGYKLFHEYHFFEQTSGYTEFITYFMEHYNRFVPRFATDSLNSLSIVPDNWYGYVREDVDMNTKRNAVKNGLEKYVHWERQTKKFLEDMQIEAFNAHEVAIAEKIKEHILAVDKEIKNAEREWLEIKSTDYDLPTVVSKQEHLIKKYGKKMRQLRKEFEDVKSQRD